MAELSEARWAFFLDADYARQIFNKHKSELLDLSPLFWSALQMLVKAADQSEWPDLQAAFKESYKQLGAPGDFGYGTPCGDALKLLYESWNKLCEAEAKQQVAQSAK